MLCMKKPQHMTLIWRHFGTKCPLGRVDSHCTILLESTFYWIPKGEKERLISLFKCADKFENWQYAHWSSFSICQNPTPIHFNKHPSIEIPPKPPSLSPPHPLGTLFNRRLSSVPCLRKDFILGSKNSEEKWVLCRAGLGMAYWLRVFVVMGAVMPINIVRVYICLTVVW